MKVKPEQLPSLGYRLDNELNHTQLIPFVKSNLRQRNPVSLFYWSFNVVTFAGFIYFLIREQRLTTFQCLMQAFLGVFLFFIILLPVHELIHGLFYKILGAKKVSFAAQWRQLVFYGVADGFVADMKEFLIVALTPFIIINSALVLFMFFASSNLFWTLFGALILHTGGCFGDYGLVSYFYNNRKQSPCTYDNAADKKTFFYLKQTT